mmetsp:Transcript_14771/g.14184  ORF Transcript_14771/g.14184 Transcript_14771/m.14184 type:complete len:189 (+) Transcript_14771:62-628(+)
MSMSQRNTKNTELKGKGNEKKDGSFSTYQTMMIEHPIAMNIIQSVVISTGSVLVSQYLAGNSMIDWSEIYTVQIVAAFWITPILLFFYSKLQKMSLGVVGKLLIDQALFSPVFTASIVTIRVLILGRVPYSELPAILIQTVPKAVLSAWTFWIPARWFTLAVVPPHLHLLTGNALSFVWNIILSMLLA